MAIKLEQLSQHLSPLKGAYLLSGDENLLVMEAQDAIRNAARDQGFTERQVYSVSRGFNFDELNAEADNLSLFAEKKIIELRFEKVPDKSQQTQIKQLFAEMNPDQTWIVTCPKLEKRQMTSQWVKAIESQGVAIQVWPIASYQLPQWIEQRAKQYGLQLTREAVQVLADQSEGNLLAAKQDLDKLALLSLNDVIDEATVLEAVANNARYTTFELMDTALKGDSKKCVRMLKRLQSEGIVPVILVSTLYRECRQLLKMSLAVQGGQSVPDTIKAFRVWSTRSRIVSQALNRLPVTVWQRIVARCAHLDKLSKGAEKGNVWDELLTCLLLMGGKSLWKKVV